MNTYASKERLIFYSSSSTQRENKCFIINYMVSHISFFFHYHWYPICPTQTLITARDTFRSQERLLLSHKTMFSSALC